MPGKAASQASITDWLEKSCNDTLTDGLSDMQELIPPTENMLEHDTSIYDFPDTDLESEVCQVSHSILTPNFCTNKFKVFHNAAHNYSLTVNVPSISDDENSSEIDMSGSSPEDDHFHLMMETDSDDDTSVDDMDYDQCNDVCTHVEVLNEKSNLTIPQLIVTMV